jgi:hypothetical protein
MGKVARLQAEGELNYRAPERVGRRGGSGRKRKGPPAGSGAFPGAGQLRAGGDRDPAAGTLSPVRQRGKRGGKLADPAAEARRVERGRTAAAQRKAEAHELTRRIEAGIEPPAKPVFVAPARPVYTPRTFGRVVGCCWPIGDPGTSAFRFCAAASEAGRPYCPDHGRRAYQRAPAVAAGRPGALP